MSTTETFATAGVIDWTCPAFVFLLNSVECVGAGGGGAEFPGENGAGGGAGGGHAKKNNVVVVPGNHYPGSVGAAGVHGEAPTGGGNTTFNTSTCSAPGGPASVDQVTGGASVSTASGLFIGDTKLRGGFGYDGDFPDGGGGAGSAGTAAAGRATTAGAATQVAGATAVTGGSTGGRAATTTVASAVGSGSGAGGGGGAESGNTAGSNGTDGKVILIYAFQYTVSATLTCVCTVTGDLTVVAVPDSSYNPVILNNDNAKFGFSFRF